MLLALPDVHVAWTFFILLAPHERINFGDFRLMFSEWVLREHNFFDLCSFLLYSCPYDHDLYPVFSCCPGYSFTNATLTLTDWRQRANYPSPCPFRLTEDSIQKYNVLHLGTYLTVYISAVSSSLAWCTCVIRSVLFARDQVVYLRNHKFLTILIKAALACIQNEWWV